VRSGREKKKERAKKEEKKVPEYITVANTAGADCVGIGGGSGLGER